MRSDTTMPARGVAWVLVLPRRVFMTLSVCAWATVAQAQANSDYIAYPKNSHAMEVYVRDQRQLTFNRMPGLSPDYKLGSGDELEIVAVGLPLPKTGYRINSAGEIALPLIGPVKVADLTAEEAEQAISLQLKQRDLVRDPEVLIFISSYEAKPIYVIGEVDRPGEYVMSQQLTLMDLIFIAGGLDLTADRYGYLHRRNGRPTPAGWTPTSALKTPDMPLQGTEVVKVDLEPMKRGGVISPNPALQKGDLLVIPRRSVAVCYVIGDVNKAGAFEFPTDAGLSASRAIAWAGGPTKTARTNKGILVRYDGAGRREERPVDFSAILTGRQPDFPVQANDVIYIPGSTSKSIGQGLLGAVPGIVYSGMMVQ